MFIREQITNMYVTKHCYSGSQVSNTQIYQFTFATVNREINNYCTQLCFIYGMQQIPIIPIKIPTHNSHPTAVQQCNPNLYVYNREKKILPLDLRRENHPDLTLVKNVNCQWLLHRPYVLLK